MINKKQFLIGALISIFLLYITFSLAAFIPPIVGTANDNNTMFPSNANEKCITGCVNDILNKTFIINNTNEVSGDAQNLVDMLKNMNFNLSAELDSCQTKLDNKNGINPTVIWITISLLVILLIWKTFLIFDKKKRTADLDR
jgi:hypothetical protein